MITSIHLTHKNLEILKRIGEGGSGAVYQAYQSILNREVAVKVILPHFANHPDFIRNFELEAQLVARLEHPHIVPLYDFWRDPQGAYLVMRYLRGGSLKTRLEKGSLSMEKIDQLLDELTSALTAAHRASVVHRDLKPDNILLDEDGSAYLSDFGIARSAGYNPGEEGVSGTLAYMAPEQLKGHSTSVAMDIYSLGIILLEMLTGQHPYTGYTAGQLVQMHISESLPDLHQFSADLPDAIHAIVEKATDRNPDGRYHNARDLWREFHRVISKGETASLDQEVFERRNPYKGLRPFDEADARDFFGREAVIGLLRERMSEIVPYRNFLAVIGASGSGKSSLIRAGLIPILRSGEITGSNRWFICEMVPGSNPLSALTQALLSVAPGTTPRLKEQLEDSPKGLLWAVDNMMANVDGDLLLFIDQFEELFTLTEDEAERTHFLELLRHAVSADESRLRVIITLRADFYDRPLLYEGFGEIVQRRTQVILPLNAGEIERAITGPAHRVGVQVNSDLIAAIVADMRQEPGALPLLQYALTEVFERCEGNVLLLDAYLESGGVEGALARRAEDVYQGLNPSEQETAHQLFLRLVTLNDYAADTRRRTTQSELFSSSGASREEVEAVLAKFGDYRLLAFDRDSVTREPTIEIAHEALIRGWERLRRWLDESREDLQLQRQLALVAADWVEAGRDESYLLRGTRIIQFKEWAEKTTLKLSSVERELLDASIRQQEREIQIQEEAQREKERLTARAQRQQKALMVVLVIGFVVTGILGLLATVQGNNARIEADQNATAQFVAEEARATSEASANELRLAVDQIRSLNMSDTALQALRAGDIDTAITLAFAANQIPQPPAQVGRALSTISGSVGTWKLFDGHSRDVQSIAYNPDGTKLVSASQDRTLILWDVADGSILHQMEGHQDIVLSVAYSPDGRTIVSGDASGVVLLWDAETGEQIGEFEGHSDNVHALAYSPDGTQIASASSDATLIVWDVESGAEVHRMTGHFFPVLAVAFSSDGTQVASGASDGSLIVWDAASGERLLKLDAHEESINALAFRPDFMQAVSGSSDGTLQVWNTETGDLLQTLNGHDGSVLSVSFSRDGRQIVSGGADNTLRLWDSSGGTATRIYNGHSGRVRAVAFSPDGYSIASGSADDTVRLWLTQYIPLDRPLTLAGHSDDVKKAAFSPDGTMVLSGAGTLFDTNPLDNSLILWDWTTGNILHRFEGHTDSITSVVFSPDGTQALSASRDNSLILWDVATGEIIRRFEGHSDWVWSAVFSPDGTKALSASRDASLILWDVATGEIIRQFTGHAEWVNAGVFSADGTQIVSGSDDGKVILWNAETGEAIREFSGHDGPVHDVAISPDGSTIYSGSSDWTSIVWDAATGEIRYQFFDQQGAVNTVGYSPDGTTLVSGAADGTVILWDAATGDRVRSFQADSDAIVRSAGFSPDGQWLAVSLDSGLIQVYALNRQVVMDWIGEHVYLRPFDCAEREKFVLEPLCEAGES